MNFIKTFLITFLTYLVLNLVFVLIAVFTIPGFPMNDILYIITLIFAPIFVFPSEAWAGGLATLIITTEIATDLLTFFAAIIPPLVAVILAARLGEERDTGFNAWFITSLIFCVVYAILFGVGQLSSANLALEWFGYTAIYGELGTVLAMFLAGIINGFFYGGIDLVIARKFL